MSSPTFTFPQTVKYRCHTLEYGIVVPNYGWSDHKRYRKVMKEDELCPKCERKLEREMLRGLYWLNHRNGFSIEYISIYRNGESPMTSPEWPLFTESESESEFTEAQESPGWSSRGDMEDEEDEEEEQEEQGKNEEEQKEDEGGEDQESPQQRLLAALFALLIADSDEESDDDEEFSTTETDDEAPEEEEISSAGPDTINEAGVLDQMALAWACR
ncbi:uncharacterized protein B0H64DRAFT_428657 [Chaetomium fimeti]|uniref:Uncharacterized protein n=1 Tax=Chaetomium fimeti TaxID=1854472 RepID=A0AAE0HQ72_9PEZI|nr:hypothetical protein B0H64DRAFT_428657 [Chaetomium fimeti]